MYNLIPSYTIGNHSIGISLIGQSDAFAQDANELVLPGVIALILYPDLFWNPCSTIRGVKANYLFNFEKSKAQYTYRI